MFTGYVGDRFSMYRPADISKRTVRSVVSDILFIYIRSNAYARTSLGSRLRR